MEFTAEKVAQDYQNLGNPNLEIRQKANQDLLEFKASPQAWVISRTLLSNHVSQNLQFLGAQVLYLKIKGDFATLQDDDKNEVQQFIFNAINDGLAKYNVPTFRQLCASATVIAIRAMPVNWGNFVLDMMDLANSSNENLFGVLEIFSNFYREFTHLQIQERHRIKIKELFKIANDLISNFFYVILEKTTDSRVVVKCLQCISSFAEIDAFETLHYPKLVQLILQHLNSEETFESGIEALCESVHHSIYADILSSSKFSSAMNIIQEEAKISIKKLIEFLISDVSPKYFEQKEMNKSIFCKGVTELATYIGMYFAIFILENTDHSKALLKFILLCTSHNDRKISCITFEFWEKFRQVLLGADILPHIKNADYLFITEIYIELYKIIIQKCKLTTLRVLPIGEARKIKIYNVDTEQEEDYDEAELQIDFKKNSVSIKEYRTLAEEIFWCCYVILAEIQEEEGLKAIFSLIIPLLDPRYATENNINLNDSNARADYILNCETVLFSVKYMLRNMNKATPHPYVIEIIKAALALPREDMLTREYLNFLSVAAPQTKFIPEFANQLFTYCLKDITNSNTVNAAAKSFYGLTKELGDKISLEVLENIATLMENEIYLIEDKNASENIIFGVFEITNKISNQEIKVTLLQKIFTSAEEKFQTFAQCLQKNDSSILNNPALINDALKLFKTITNIFRGFKQECLKNSIISEELLNHTALPFVIKNIDHICSYIELFSSQLQFIEIFSLMLKIFVEICGIKLEGSYLKILNLILQIFGTNPQQNWRLLGTAGDLILYFKDSEVQKQWLLNNFSDFNTSILSYLTAQRDTDLLPKWLLILQNSYCAYPEYFLNLPEIDRIMEFILITFLNATEFPLLKKIATFINLFVDKKTFVYHATTLKLLPKIAEVMFTKMLSLENNSMVANIISNILLRIEEDKAQLVQLLLSALNNERFSEIDEKKRTIFLEAIFAYRDDSRMVNNFLRAFKEFVLDPNLMVDSMFFIEEKLATYNRNHS